MGCDIHLQIEHKDPSLGDWCVWARPTAGRSYPVFTALADPGRRRPGDPDTLYPARGYPDDPATWGNWDDDANRVHPEDPDLHTFSWLTTEELRSVIALIVQHFEEQGWGGSAPWWLVAAHEAMEQMEKSGHSARLVFAFDN